MCKYIGGCQQIFQASGFWIGKAWDELDGGCSLLVSPIRLANAKPIARCLGTSTVNARPVNFVKELHGHLIRKHLHTDPSFMFKIIKWYALSPANLLRAQFAFDQINHPNLLLWNLMIRGWSHSDQPTEAICMHKLMYHQGLHGNNLIFIFILKACTRVSAAVYGKLIHSHSFKLGFGSYPYVSNALIHMYASCGDLNLAQKLFDEMEERDLVSWNSLICGYSQCGKFREVLGVFKALQTANVKADSVTIMKAVLACFVLGEWDLADLMVEYIEGNHVPIDLFLGNTLIDMYG